MLGDPPAGVLSGDVGRCREILLGGLLGDVGGNVGGNPGGNVADVRSNVGGNFYSISAMYLAFRQYLMHDLRHFGNV